MPGRVPSKWTALTSLRADGGCDRRVVASDPVGLHGEEVGARHASGGTVEIGGGLVREEGADPVDPCRRAAPRSPSPSHRARARAPPWRPAHERASAATTSRRRVRSPRHPPWPGGRARRVARAYPITAATSRMRFSSDRSRRVAVSGSSRCSFDHEPARSRSGDATPIAIEDRRDDREPDRHVAALAVLADVVQQRSEQHGVAGRRPRRWRTASAWTGSSPAPVPPRSRPIARSEVVRCASTVKRWYGSRCGRQRTSVHSGTNAARIPSRSRTSRDHAPRSPARRSRENAGTHALVPLHHLRQFEVVDRVQQRRRRLPAGLGLGGQRIQHAGRGRRRRDRCGAVLVEPLDHRAEQELHVARVLEQGPHQPVDRDEPGFVDEPHRGRDRRLVIEHQAIAALARLQVQRAANPGEELLGGRERLALTTAEEPGVLQRLPTAASSSQIEWRSRQPPEPSFRSGSSRCAAEPARSARRAASSRSHRANARGSRRTHASILASDVGDERPPRRRPAGCPPSTRRRPAGRRPPRTPPACGPRDRPRTRRSTADTAGRPRAARPRRGRIRRAATSRSMSERGKEQPSPVAPDRGHGRPRPARRRARTARRARRPPARRAGAPTTRP